MDLNFKTFFLSKYEDDKSGVLCVYIFMSIAFEIFDTCVI